MRQQSWLSPPRFHQAYDAAQNRFFVQQAEACLLCEGDHILETADENYLVACFHLRGLGCDCFMWGT